MVLYKEDEWATGIYICELNGKLGNYCDVDIDCSVYSCKSVACVVCSV